jgi:hypothetical protein
MYNGIRIGSGSYTSESANTASTGTNKKLARKGSSSDHTLLLLDVMDTVNLLETEMQSMGSGVATMSQALHNMTHSVDKFAKYMKTNEYQENDGTYILYYYCVALLTEYNKMLLSN